MKNLLYLFIIIFIFACDDSKLIKLDAKETLVHITNVSVGKYTRIEGYINYKGKKLYCDNGNSGYYHKKYSLKKGDLVFKKVYIQFYNHSDGRITMKTSNINFDEFVIK